MLKQSNLKNIIFTGSILTTLFTVTCDTSEYVQNRHNMSKKCTSAQRTMRSAYELETKIK